MLVLVTGLGFICSKANGAVPFWVPGGPSEPGNSSLAAPFQTSTSSRLQQVYGESAFRFVEPGQGFLIREIHFRLDEAMGVPFSETFPDFQVNLSTTSRGPDQLSPVFAENIGANQTTVYTRSSLAVSASRIGFSVQIPFSRPFLYDPYAGNLLLDISNFQPGTASPLDAVAKLGDSVSIVGGRATDLQGLTFTAGLATEFVVDIVPIPEPRTWALLLLAGAVLVSSSMHRRLCHMRHQ